MKPCMLTKEEIDRLDLSFSWLLGRYRVQLQPWRHGAGLVLAEPILPVDQLIGLMVAHPMSQDLRGPAWDDPAQDSSFDIGVIVSVHPDELHNKHLQPGEPESWRATFNNGGSKLTYALNNLWTPYTDELEQKLLARLRG